jgi:hypothetical protein
MLLNENNDLVKLYNKFHDAEIFPMTISDNLKKIAIPVKDDIRPTRNFLDCWSEREQTAYICTNSYTMEKFKKYDYSLYEKLSGYIQKTKKDQADKKKTTVLLHKGYYSYELAHSMLSLLKDDYTDNVRPKKKVSCQSENNHTNIYLVAGIRNTSPGAVSYNGGLWANVGQSIDPESRIKDPDYRKKQLGGKRILIKQWPVTNITDKQLHPHLKNHPEVIWNKSNNTEEFLFTSDTGDGSAAIKIIESILIELMDLPEFVIDKFSAQQKKIEALNCKLGRHDAANYSLLRGSWVNKFVSLFWCMLLSIRL